MRVTDRYGDYVAFEDGKWTCGGGEYSSTVVHLEINKLWLEAQTKEGRVMLHLDAVPGLFPLFSLYSLFSLWESHQRGGFKQASDKKNPMGFSSGLLQEKLSLFESYKVNPSYGITEIWDHLSHPGTGVSTYRVFREGAKKHPAEESWLQMEDAVAIYEQALFRHYLWELYYPDSNGVDESGEPHSSHALANCAILHELFSKEGK